MADKTLIEWSDSTWNPITGCAVVSPGCTNCYAMKLAGTRLQHHPSRAGLTKDTKAGPVWTGEVRFNEAWLDQPVRWAKPRMIFVCAHGDLFAEGVPDAWIDMVFAVMASASQHTFQVLTKRPARMREYLLALQAEGPERLRHYVDVTMAPSRAARQALVPSMSEPAPPTPELRALFDRAIPAMLDRGVRLDSNRISGVDFPECHWRSWPLSNVWLGVSAEDQRRADERVPVLRDTPAAVRWVSAEPLLGRIDFSPWLEGDEVHGMVGNCVGWIPGIDWIVAGGESGTGARPMHADWVRSIRDQCAAAGTAFLFKQHGAWAPLQSGDGTWPTDLKNYCRLRTDGSRGDDGWPMQRVGKTAAGRLLDGVQHDGYPEVSHG